MSEPNWFHDSYWDSEKELHPIPSFKVKQTMTERTVEGLREAVYRAATTCQSRCDVEILAAVVDYLGFTKKDMEALRVAADDVWHPENSKRISLTADALALLLDASNE